MKAFDRIASLHVNYRALLDLCRSLIALSGNRGVLAAPQVIFFERVANTGIVYLLFVCSDLPFQSSSASRGCPLQRRRWSNGDPPGHPLPGEAGGAPSRGGGGRGVSRRPPEGAEAQDGADAGETYGKRIVAFQIKSTFLSLRTSTSSSTPAFGTLSTPEGSCSAEVMGSEMPCYKCHARISP